MIVSALPLWLVRFGVVAGWTSALYTIYQVTNHYHLFVPRLLPLTWLDTSIPFVPWTVVPYFMLIGGMYLPAAVTERALFIRTLMAITVGVLINYAVFAVFPTTYPRPAPPIGDGCHLSWYRWLISIDSPANCFPSGHITAPAIGCWALAQEHPRWRWVIAVAFIPFALSILTTKQHYVVDLFGGLATGWIGIWVSGLMMSRSTPPTLPWVK